MSGGSLGLDNDLMCARTKQRGVCKDTLSIPGGEGGLKLELNEDNVLSKPEGGLSFAHCAARTFATQCRPFFPFVAAGGGLREVLGRENDFEREALLRKLTGPRSLDRPRRWPVMRSRTSGLWSDCK